MECYVNLREKGTAINIRLTETWWRHYQVGSLFPFRTQGPVSRNLPAPKTIFGANIFQQRISFTDLKANC